MNDLLPRPRRLIGVTLDGEPIFEVPEGTFTLHKKIAKVDLIADP